MPRIDLSKLPDQEPVAPLAGAEPTIDLEGIPDKVTKPLTSPERLPRWEDVKGKLPANLKDYEQAGKDAISVAATYDLDMNAAYNIQDKVKEELGETDLFDKAVGSFKAGIGDVYVGLGNTLKWAGMSEEFSDVYVDYGERMRVAYIPPEDTSEFTWRKTIDPEWWATSVTRAVPFTLSLIPAAVVGAYAGAAAGGAAAGAAGLGAFGTTVLTTTGGAVGGAALSRPVESAFEAAAAYEESLARGDSEEDASAAADKVFTSNMMLAGMDAAQFALAFSPLKFGKGLNPSLLRRISAGTGKLSAVALSEAGEERYQEYVQMEALGEEANFFDLDNPRLNEASTIGGIFGAGMGGTGSVWTALTRKTTEAMPEDVKQTFDVAKGNAMLDGMEEADATRVALDAVAETPEGKEHIEKVINDLKAASTKEMGAKAPEITAPTMEQLMERLQTEDLTEEELGSLLDQFAGGRDVIEEIQSEPVAAIKERLIATGMDEVEASANAALFDGFRVLAQRAGVPVEDVMARYLPEVSREGVEAPAPVVTEEDRRAITDNPFLSDQITTEEQLTDVESLRTARERINETLVEQREEQTVSDEEMKQLEEAVGFLDEKITAPAIPDTEAVADMDVLEQSAYHGTPHKFDKFTLDHIGTGEGAQAYGWGLYFAESKGVAEFYREQLTKPDIFDETLGFSFEGQEYDKLSPEGHALSLIKSDGKREARRISKEMLSDAKDGKPYTQERGKGVSHYQRLDDFVANFDSKKRSKIKDVKEEKEGALLKVELAPKADEWLDWDKPLNKQSKKIKDILKDAGVTKRYNANLQDFATPMITRGREKRGSNIYAFLEFEQGGDREASLYLKKLGIPGIKYLDATSRDKQRGTSNYVVFDDELITIEEYLQAKQEGITPEEPRGRIRISPDGINIDLLKGADQSTFLHETGHLYFKIMSDLVQLPTASEDLKADYQTVRDWLGAEEGADLTVDQQEQFARGFEAYLREGKAPSSALAEAFENFKQWLMQIYKSLRDLNVQLTDEVRGVMDRMLADDGVDRAEVEPVPLEAGVDADGVSYDQAGIIQTETEAFKEWFGNSKVVDENGEPLVVYHGSPVEFEAFDPSKMGEGHDVEGAGFYFTNSRDEAEAYRHGDQRLSSAVKAKGPVYEVYLRIENPVPLEGEVNRSEIEKIVLNSIGLESVEQVDDWFEADEDAFWESPLSNWAEDPTTAFYEAVNAIMQDETPHEAFQTVWYDIFNADNAAYMEAMLKLGYDGVIIPKEERHAGNDHYLVFDPKSIKSTTNQGTFDPEDPRILYQAAPAKITNIRQLAKSLGGIDYNKEHLKGELNKLKEDAPATRLLINKRDQGVTLDRLLESAIEAGILGEAATLDDVINALEVNLQTPEAIQEELAKEERVRRRAETKAYKTEELRKEFVELAVKARKAYREGKNYGAVKEARKLKNILARTRKLRLVRDYFNLTDADLKKISRKNPLLLSQYEFKLYLDDVRIKAAQLSQTQLEKAMLINMIHDKDLGRVDNYRRVLGLPTIANMTVEQVRTFAAALEPFHDGDVFLSERELETVDRTDLAGIATWREAKERLAAEIGISIEELEKIKVKEWDEYKWDTALAEANPFYKMLVTETTRKLLEADFRYHEIENELYDLARKSEKSRGRTLVEKAIPQDKQVMEYLETPAEERTALAEEMTPEQIDLARYMEAYFEIALKYLIKTKSLERGRENYFVHMRRTFLENVKEEGLVGAFRDLFKTYQEDEAVFNIMDEDTGNILPLEKFFQFSLRRTGGIDPTTNVTRAFLTYAQMMEKKISLDELIPKMDIYAQSITPQMYTPRGLEIDRSLKKFVNKYINNKKGRRIRWIAKQGGTIDVSIRGLRTFTTVVDLGLNIPSGIAAFTGEQVTNFAMLGTKAFAKGNARIATKKGKKIINKYEAFIGRSAWEEFTAPGKQLTERISDGMFGLFHEASVLANKQFLLGAITDEEYNSGEITSERLAILKIEMGRLRVVPGTKSMVGSTSAGSAMMQYKTWAAPIISTMSKDAATLVRDLAKKPTGEALTSREAREIYRLIGITTTALIVGATALSESDDDTFTGQMLKKVYRESMTLLQGVDPSLWLATPRLMGFLTQLGKNLKAIATLEEYKTKPGLKGVEGLQRQLTPRAIKQFIPKETKKEKL